MIKVNILISISYSSNQSAERLFQKCYVSRTVQVSSPYLMDKHLKAEVF